MKKRIETINECKKKLGKQYHDYGLLFCHDNGDPIEPNLLEKWFTAWQQKYAKDLEVPQLVFHGLRHSSTTYKLVESQGDIKSVQADSGHADAKILLDVYAHIMQNNRLNLVKKMDREMTDYNNRYVQAKGAKKQQNDSVESLICKIKQDPQLQNQILLALLAQKTQP